ncbi:hypothetical protein H8959_016854 [Pygathrix nigripes]
MKMLEDSQSGQDMVSILQLVQNLMHGDEDEEPQSPRIQNIGEQGHMALLGHSLGAYISTLDKEKLRKLTTRILSDTTLWLCRIFRYENGCAYFHEEEREGLAKICRLAIHSRYEDFVVDGFNVLCNKKPVIYLSAAARPGLGQYLCNQLGLPFPCLCRVPCNTMFGSQHQMDVAFLEKMIKDDIERGRLPLLLVANAGTAAAGHTDKIGRLKELCEQYSVWLHVEGFQAHNCISSNSEMDPTNYDRNDDTFERLGCFIGLRSTCTHRKKRVSSFPGIKIALEDLFTSRSFMEARARAEVHKVTAKVNSHYQINGQRKTTEKGKLRMKQREPAEKEKQLSEAEENAKLVMKKIHTYK